jgi:lipopolysaccharide transport system ATP-binding protein
MNKLISLSPKAPSSHPINSTEALAIAVHDVSKMYPLYANPHDRLQQAIWSAVPPFLRGKSRQFYREFWALQNISFEIKKGESVGIVGRNGSGKSTLLQIIAGVLTPTQGYAQVNGKVTALLELGSGFNLEFTGRENVYLNGAILGFSQAEIDRVYEDILAFADIGQFIDQPIKLYSSGMMVRLAFAVQVFVPKQILIVDEALAVGDAAFQRKCMRALERFKDEGGTVLFVSHDTQTVVRQCNRCLLLSEGRLIVDGDSKPVTDVYQKILHSNPQQVAEIVALLRQHGLGTTLTPDRVKPDDPVNPEQAVPWPKNGTEMPIQGPADGFDPNLPATPEIVYGSGEAEIFEYGMYNEAGEQVNIVVVGRRYRWSYKVKFHQAAYKVHFGMMLKTQDGLDVAGISSDREQVYFDYIPASAIIQASFSIRLNLAPGVYFMNAGVFGHTHETATYLARRVDICVIRVLPCDAREVYGIAYLEPHFTYTFEDEDKAQENMASEKSYRASA